MDLLFSPPARPLSGRYVDPGDMKRRRVKSHRPPGTPPRPRPTKELPYKPNPFRQPIADPDETDFRHERWSGQRRVVRSTLTGAGTSGHALDRFDNCGAECVVEWSDTLQRYRLRASYCRCRHCRPCAKAKGSVIAANLTARLKEGATKDGDRFRFVTLTLRHSRRPLADQVKALYAHWNALRRTTFWKRSQRGGAAMVEVGLNAVGEWHPHLHIISEGDFLRQSTLANEWMRVTGGSFKVDVRAINSGKDAARYVAKYVAKGTSDAVWNDPQKANEWVCATKGLRTCATFGTWRGFKLLKVDPAQQAEDWKPVGLLARIAAQARGGSVADMNLLHILADALQYDPGRVRIHRPEAPPGT